MILAHKTNKANTGSHGFPLDVATDPDNWWRIEVPPPTVDYVALEIEKAQDAYVKKNFTDKKLPVKLGGLLWSARLKPKPEAGDRHA